jgi:hypothetical protein
MLEPMTHLYTIERRHHVIRYQEIRELLGTLIDSFLPIGYHYRLVP